MVSNECNVTRNDSTSSMGQFRATRTWNAIVEAVREELPVGRRRKGLRVYENCFTGDEAVTWMVDYLEQNRERLLIGGANSKGGKGAITRAKVTLLLQKFVEQKIIEDVRGSRDSFRDSSRCLYMFNKENIAPQLATFKAVPTTYKVDNGRVHKNRCAGLNKVSILKDYHLLFS